jgi:hypothetical protein
LVALDREENAVVPLLGTVQVAPKAQGVPFSVIELFANTVFGIALAATASEGVVVEFVTVGTNHVGQLPEGAAKEFTVPPPPPEIVQDPPTGHAVELIVTLGAVPVRPDHGTFVAVAAFPVVF